jgi:BirA family biotin operon repressor/biotin-[acetyl-CoA-carboxylase] ligase
LESLDVFCNLLTKEGAPSILRAFAAASSYVAGRRVCLEEDGAVGTTAGLDENGFLLIRLEDGKLRKVASGGIRLA